jgi:hypothetical protein
MNRGFSLRQAAVQPRKKLKVRFGKHDKSHCLADGLFKSLPKRERPKLDVYHETKDYRVRFVGFEALGADDLRVLQTLVAIASKRNNRMVLTNQPETPIGQELYKLLWIKGDHMDSVVIELSVRRILNEMGERVSGKRASLLKNSLLRMSNVTVAVEGHRHMATFHLLRFALDKHAEGLYIVLNPLIASAVLGKGNGYVHIDMDEVRAIKSDPARLIHQHLCGWLDPGKEGTIGIDQLLVYVWGHHETHDRRILGKRRTRIQQALHEIKALGWDVVELKAERKYSIRRPE